MDTTRRSARNDLILALRAKGMTQRAIAAHVGLTERQVRRVLRERAGPSPPDQGDDRTAAPATVLLDELEDAVATLATLAALHAGAHSRRGAVDTARTLLRAERAITALRARADALTSTHSEGDMSGHNASATGATEQPDDDG